MGFLDHIKKGLKKAADATAKFLDEQAKKSRYSNEIHRLKHMLLLRFNKSQLEQVAAMYRVSLYVQPDPFDDRTIRLRSKTDIAEHLANHLTYNEVLEAAHHFHIQYADIEREKERIYLQIFGEPEDTPQQEGVPVTAPQPTTQEQQAQAPVEQQDPYLATMFQLKDLLEHEFVPQPVRDESEFKAQIYQYLVAKLGVENVKQEMMLGGRKVDLVLWNTIAVELKLAKGQQDLINLLGECIKLKKNGTPYVMAVILDIGKYPNLQADVRDLADLEVLPVIVKGSLRKSRKKKITVEFK